MNDAIVTDRLTKRYRAVLAVDALSIQVRQGEIYGFLGLNGAGKTTTIRMLLGMIRPTAGIAHIFGQRVSVGAQDLWKRVGYLVETPYAYPELTVRENLDAARRLRRVSDPKAVDRIMQALALDQYADRRTATLSQGNAQRLGLAKALMHKPDLLLLDEPANGLDPAGVVEIRELLRRLTAQDGVTVLMSSHILTEVARLATRIGIIHKGRLLEELDSAQLEARLRRRLVIGTLDQRAARAVLDRAGFAVADDGDDRLAVADADAVEHPERLAQLLVAAGVPLTLLKPQQEDLETHFLRLVDADGGNE
jgi:ABC-2 type transport system ATP-binding protein